MEKLQMCRICLAENVHMCVVVNKQLRQLYEKLTDVPFVTEDSRPILACDICCAQLKKCYRFQKKCLEAEEQFAQMLKEGYERKPLIDPLDILHGLIIAPIVSLSIFDELQTESIVERQEKNIVETGEEHIVETEEPTADYEEVNDILQPKEEHEIDDGRFVHLLHTPQPKMDKLQMCRICLAENVHMCVVVNKQLRQLYEKLTDVPFVTEDSRPILACYICCAQLKKCYRLMEKCLEAEEQFTQMLKEGYERKPLIDPLDILHGLIIAPIVSLSIFDELQTESILERQEKNIVETGEEHIFETEEPTADYEEVNDILQPKKEHDIDDDLKTENVTVDNDTPIEDTPQHHSESDAEDEVPSKKVKKTVKKKQLKTGKQKVRQTKRKVTEKQKVCQTKRKVTGKQRVCNTKPKITEKQKVRKAKQKLKELKKRWNHGKVGRNLDIEKRAKIIEMFQEGYSKTLISETLELSRNAVATWVKRYNEEGSVEHRHRTGRPKRISEEQRQQMVSHFEINGFLPTSHFAELFDTSVHTVRRALKSAGIHSRRPAKKLFFSEKHKKERLSFAHDFLDFDWNTTIFSDERTFKINQYGRLVLRRREERGIYETDPDEKIKITMWGWMSAAGPGELVFIPRCTKSSAYVDLLDDVMLPTIRNVYPPEELTDLIFVRDNSPIYKAGIVRDWFHNHPEITVVPWPARSPDLNPIEHVWALMVQRWVCRGETDVEHLKTHCMNVWESLRGTDICSNIIASMRSRLLKCIETDGAYIKC